MSLIAKPKEKLKEHTSKAGKTKQYEESHAPELFAKINIKTVMDNCSYFRGFVLEFSKIVYDSV